MLNHKAIELIAQDAEVSKNDVILVLGALADLLKETVHDKGEAVSIKGLGTFKANKSSAVISLVTLFSDNEEETSV